MTEETLPLLPCPFCGNNDPDIGQSAHGGWYVTCEFHGCGAELAGRATKEAAAEAWNARTGGLAEALTLAEAEAEIERKNKALNGLERRLAGHGYPEGGGMRSLIRAALTVRDVRPSTAFLDSRLGTDADLQTLAYYGGQKYDTAPSARGARFTEPEDTSQND